MISSALFSLRYTKLKFIFELHCLDTEQLKQLNRLSSPQQIVRHSSKMPRSMAPPPSGEFSIVLSRPFSGKRHLKPTSQDTYTEISFRNSNTHGRSHRRAKPLSHCQNIPEQRRQQHDQEEWRCPEVTIPINASIRVNSTTKLTCYTEMT